MCVCVSVTEREKELVSEGEIVISIRAAARCHGPGCDLPVLATARLGKRLRGWSRSLPG